jgi:hypothetical protein
VHNSPNIEADVQRRILDAVDSLAPALVTALSDAVRIPSINPRYPGQTYADHIGRESEVSALVGDIYRSAGADVDMVTETTRAVGSSARGAVHRSSSTVTSTWFPPTRASGAGIPSPVS